MSARVYLFALLAATLACTPGSLQPGDMGQSGGGGGGGADSPGTAGITTIGTGGDAGSTGAGGSGGLPACADPQYGTMEINIAGPDAALVTTAAAAQVTVISADNCASAMCAWTDPFIPGATISDTSMATARFVVAAGSQQWTIYLNLPGVPGDLVQIGDVFDMTIDASVDQTVYDSVNQTIVLARGGKLVLFASWRGSAMGPPLPSLELYGIGLSDVGPACERSIGCMDLPHAVRVDNETGTAVARVGQTVQVGTLSFTNGRTLSYPDTNCDSKAWAQVGGFTLP
ncbi:MAG TPA: hypothetical protein VKQ32_23455 [Polyangia bacterium]|nr:hypothetical protein [Polyangia bacterium]